MKRHHLLTALSGQLLLSGAAFAQLATPPVPTSAAPAPSGTGVQIYGLVTAGVTMVSNQAGGGSLTTVGSSPLSASLIGFRGREDLGDGMSAVFRLESSIDNSGANGTSGATVAGTSKFWNRQAFAGLGFDNEAVLVTAGRQFSAGVDRAIRTMDPYNLGGNILASTPMAVFGVNRYYVAAGTPAYAGATGTDNRVDNSVKVRVNGPMGLTAAVSASPNEGEGRNLSFDLAQQTQEYAVGTFYINYHAPTALANGSTPQNTLWGAAGNVLVGPVRLYLGLMRSSIDSTIAGNPAQVNKLIVPSLNWLISPQWVYRLSYTHDQGSSLFTAPTYNGNKNGTKNTWITSVDYYLSKRTSLYATVFNNRYTGGYQYELLNTSVRSAVFTSSTGYSVGMQTSF